MREPSADRQLACGRTMQGPRGAIETRSRLPRSACRLLKHVQRDAWCGRSSFLDRWSAFTRGDGLRLGFANGLHLAAVDAALAQVDLELGGPSQRSLDQRLAERILDVLLQ